MKPAPVMVLALAIPIYSLALSSRQRNVRLSCDVRPDVYQASCCFHTYLPKTPISTSGNRQHKRSYQGELSKSPGDFFQQPASSVTNSTQSNDSGSQAVSWWPPSTETILTAIFRAIMAVLSLLNINVTWRIHGEYISPFLDEFKA